MKHAINWKLFGVLLLATCLAGFTVIPYILALSPNLAGIFTSKIIAAQIIQFVVLFSIAIFFGLYLGKRVGLGAPILEGILGGENKSDHCKSILGTSIGWGVFSAVLIVALSLLTPALSLSLLEVESQIAIWKLLLVPFYGGIVEEVLLRFFLMTLLVWIVSKFWRTPDGRPAAAGVWLVIIVTSALFGLGHLPITSSLATITPIVVARAVLLNGVAGVIFGWLYWKKGLESAIIAHFSADIVIHVITPVIVLGIIG